MEDQLHYSIHEHKHRFAAWAASRAASTQACRFTVLDGKSIIEETELYKLDGNPDLLPQSNDIDTRHREWRCSVVNLAQKRELQNFSHGVAAKLINIYLKSMFVCGGHAAHRKVTSLHPPIDRLLLNALHNEKESPEFEAWINARRIRWSNLNSDQYETLIDSIKKRQVRKCEELWQIEDLWRGYQ
jgi:hypothetical protein